MYRKSRKHILSFLILIIFISCGEVKHPPGILVNDIPKQTNLSSAKSWDKNDYHFRALAGFELRARVLGKESYSYDRESDIAPYDLALGWGQMSDQAVVDEIDISQRTRWYFWDTKKFPIPRREIEVNSANMHMIPSDDTIEEILSDIREGEMIYLKGYLVEVKADDGWKWKSSLSREDKGGGACEVVWVDKLLRIE